MSKHKRPKMAQRMLGGHRNRLACGLARWRNLPQAAGTHISAPTTPSQVHATCSTLWQLSKPHHENETLCRPRQHKQKSKSHSTFFFCRDERQRVYNRNLEVCHDLPHTRDVMPQVVDSQETRQRRRWTLKTHDIVCKFARAPDDQHIRRERPYNSCTIGPARVDCMIDLPRGRAGPSRQKGEGEGMG